MSAGRSEKPIPRREVYGCWWPVTWDDLEVERQCLRRGGQWDGPNGRKYGNGILYHFRRFKTLLWPDIVWHKWNLLEMEAYLEHRIIGELGPASSGKTHSGATNVLADYWCFPECTTVLVSSTTKESLEMRVWGEIKKRFRMAKAKFANLPGALIEHRQRIITDSRLEAAEGRDFRNGLVGIPCKRGQNLIGLGEYVGIKNDRVRLLADELPFMPASFVDAISNLNKNPDFKAVCLGNPKDITDAHGKICEPAAELGGWDSQIDQTPGTKTWKNRFPRGIVVQLPGSDSPNLDGKLGIPLITQNDIDADVAFWGKDSLQFTMMDEGRMPRGSGSRRIITRNQAMRNSAMDEPVWKDNNQTQLASLDAAYRGVGGDRCVLGFHQYGMNVEGIAIFHHKETLLVPVLDNRQRDSEFQVAEFVRDNCIKRNVPAERLFFDSTGRGSLATAFGQIWSPWVVGVEFGGAATERPVPGMKEIIVKGVKKTLMCYEYYFNFVTELWFSTAAIMLAGQMRGLTDDLLQEGCLREWGYHSEGVGAKIQAEPKDKMKLKSGRSPDLFDMLVTGVEGARRLGFQIDSIKLGTATTSGQRTWFRDLLKKAQEMAAKRSLSYGRP